MRLLIQCPGCKRGVPAKPSTPPSAILHCKCGGRFTRPPAPKRKRTMVQRATP